MLHTVELAQDIFSIYEIDVIDGAFMVAADLRSGTHKRWRVTLDGEVEECTSAP